MLLKQLYLWPSFTSFCQILPLHTDPILKCFIVRLQLVCIEGVSLPFLSPLAQNNPKWTGQKGQDKRDIKVLKVQEKISTKWEQKGTKGDRKM